MTATYEIVQFISCAFWKLVGFHYRATKAVGLKIKTRVTRVHKNMIKLYPKWHLNTARDLRISSALNELKFTCGFIFSNWRKTKHCIRSLAIFDRSGKLEV